MCIRDRHKTTELTQRTGFSVFRLISYGEMRKNTFRDESVHIGDPLGGISS